MLTLSGFNTTQSSFIIFNLDLTVLAFLFHYVSSEIVLAHLWKLEVIILLFNLLLYYCKSSRF